MNSLIIGLGFQKQVGKDTVADYLVRHHQFVRIAFADPLKELCAPVLDFKHKMIRESEMLSRFNTWRKRYGVEDTEYWQDFLQEVVCTPVMDFTQLDNGKPRLLLQYVGTDIFRKRAGLNFWVDRAQFRMWTLLHANPHTCFVIPDVRFENEKEFVEQKPNGFCIKVERDTNQTDAHESENALHSSRWLYTIDNRGGLSALYDQVEELLRAVGYRKELEESNECPPRQS